MFIDGLTQSQRLTWYTALSSHGTTSHPVTDFYLSSDDRSLELLIFNAIFAGFLSAFQILDTIPIQYHYSKLE